MLREHASIEDESAFAPQGMTAAVGDGDASLYNLPLIRGELIVLIEHLGRLRRELSAIRHPSEEDFAFTHMGSQLDAIVQATEDATNTIMESVEKNEALITGLRESIAEQAHLDVLDQVMENDMAIIEACSFQDITGQRVQKVMKSVAFIETRVNALIDIWGRANIEGSESDIEDTRTDDEKLLRGPALEGEAISQDDIDKMFD